MIKVKNRNKIWNYQKKLIKNFSRNATKRKKTSNSKSRTWRKHTPIWHPKTIWSELCFGVYAEISDNYCPGYILISNTNNQRSNQLKEGHVSYNVEDDQYDMQFGNPFKYHQ